MTTCSPTPLHVRLLALPALFAGLAFTLSCGDHAQDPCADPAHLPYAAPTLIGALYDSCFSIDGASFRPGSVDLLLYLDTGNLPSDNAGNPWLTVSSVPIHGVAGPDRLGLKLNGPLPSEVDPGIRGQSGWKVRLASGLADQCSTCVTSCGLVPIVDVLADVGDLEFLHDEADSMALFLRYHRTASGGRGAGPAR